MVVLDLHTGLYATGTTGMDRPTGYTEVIMALSAAGASASVLAFLGTTTDTARHHITPAKLALRAVIDRHIPPGNGRGGWPFVEFENDER
jgi:hypothetical protein